MTAPRRFAIDSTYLVTRRCSERRFFLRPSLKTNQAYLYALAYAAQRAEVRLSAAIAMSNHHHVVLTDPRARLADFAEQAHGLMARSINSTFGHWECFWARSKPYNAVLLGPHSS